MKNIFKILFAALIGILVVSCTKDEDRATAYLQSNAVLTSNVTTVVLTKPNAAQNAINFAWTNPSYGANVAITNELQFAVKGTNFASPKTVAIDAGKTAASYTVEQLNTFALALGIPTNTASQVEVRVKSSLGSSVSYSNILTLTLTPYALISYMYAPGAYQGWDPNTANTLVSANSNGIYVGFINFPAAGSEFKITQDKNWNVNYGATGSTLVSNGNNIASPGAGYYKLTVDMNTMSYTLVPYQISVIGSATPGGWGADTDMAWDNAALKWKITTTFTTGEFKFRLNHDWGTNWGDDGANGSLEAGGANIAIAGGSHTVFFNPFDLTYTVN